jgi:hypothetical protein
MAKFSVTILGDVVEIRPLNQRPDILAKQVKISEIDSFLTERAKKSRITFDSHLPNVKGILFKSDEAIDELFRLLKKARVQLEGVKPQIYAPLYSDPNGRSVIVPNTTWIQLDSKETLVQKC